MELKLSKTFFLLSLLANLHSMAQTTIQGAYYFRKQELVAGINFMPGARFQFFYSYGAVDRSATGSFSITGKTIHLKSDKAPGKDFTLTHQSKQGKGYSLRFNDSNKYLLENIRCLFFVNGKMEDFFSDREGRVSVDIDQCDSIFVQHSLYPDIVTRVKDKLNDNNNFILSLNPSLEQFSFKGIDFNIEDENTISCLPNYLMPIENIRFVKKPE